MEKAVDASNRLKEMCQFYGYCEIEPSHAESLAWVSDDGGLSKVYGWMEDEKFKVVRITKKDDVWSAFKKFFGGKL